MWGVLLGVVGVGLALYEILTRETPAAPALPAPGNPNARFAQPRPAPGDLNSPQLQQRAIACGLFAGDFRDASRWTRDNISPSLETLDALTLMYSPLAWQTWPGSVRRVYCTYIDTAPVQVWPARQPIGWH